MQENVRLREFFAGVDVRRLAHRYKEQHDRRSATGGRI
jgi:hypothetical protein